MRFFFYGQIKPFIKTWAFFKSKLLGGVGIALFFLGLGSKGYTQQNYPIQIIANVPPPVSPYLNDFGYPQAMTVNIILKGRASYSGYLRIRLESMDGRGIVLQTRANYNPVVDLGPSQTFTGVELAPYFSQQNLDFIGFDRQQYLRTKRIPDGVYKLTFSFFDRFRSNVRVSNVDILSQKILRVFSLSPPTINLPLHMVTVNSANQSAQPVPINWTRPANTPFSVNYELIINELRPSCQQSYNGMNPNNAAASRVSQAELFNCLGPEIYRTTTTALNYNYGMQAEPILKLGAWYSIRLRAFDDQGRTLFINNGYSTIRVFRYGKPCEPPPRLRVKALNPYQVEVEWDVLNTHTGYTVYFKKQGEGNEWYRQKALTNRARIDDLEPGTYYSFRVSADCNAFASELGATYELQMPSPPPSQVECGKKLVVDLSNQTPIQSLKAGDEIVAGDFKFMLTEVRPLGGGWFAGRGYTHIKLFHGARVNGRFTRIKVNTDKRLIDGEIVSTGAGVQVVPDEWKQKYLAFTGEINRLFTEIDKGLDKLDAVMGKIDEVLKKIDQWLENYQGEDKAELLETIRIGKKEIEDGKKDIKDGQVTDGVKKLKDGSGKVLGVAGKMAKDALEKLWRELKDLFQKIIEAIKNDDETSQKQLYSSMDSLSTTIDREVEKLKPQVATGTVVDSVVADSTTMVVVNANAATTISLYPKAKVYLDARQKYGEAVNKYNQKKVRLVLLVELLQKSDKLALVIQQIKDKAVNIVQEYDTLKKAGKNELQIIAGLKGLVENFLNEVVVTPFLEDNGIKK